MSPSRLAISLFGIGLSLLSASSLSADVSCPPIFGDHMVLQRDRPVPIWGTAEPGEKITIQFADQSRETIAASDGRWRVDLAPLSASHEPRVLTITGNNSLTFSDVLVGEVWFLSGQSNMEKPLGPRAGQQPTDNYEAELARADGPTLRLFQVPQHGRPKNNDSSLAWHPCSADVLMRTRFSAAGYYFGRELVRELKIPVGLIHSSFGGTRIEAWMPPEAFDFAPALGPLRTQTYQAWVKGTQPTELFVSMVAPHVPYSLRGFLWYQGETNCLNAEHFIYATKMRALIGSWRKAWGSPAAPFYYAQIAPFGYSRMEGRDKRLTPHALPALWEAQLAALDVPHTGIIPTSDIAGDGSDLHPTNKRDVGLRFARLALAETYGRPIAAHAPRFKSMRRLSDHSLELTFEHAEGLHSVSDPFTLDFQIAGADGVFFPASAEYVAGTIRLSDHLVPRPVAARHAWHELSMSNVRNAAGLPLLPFRTDDWPLVLEAGGTASVPSR